jgi:protein farnesyltransferase subunit beta
MPSKRTLEYTMRLLAHRKTVVQEVGNDDLLLQFDTMAEQVTQSTNLEKELFTDTTESQCDVEEEVRTLYDKWLETGETPHLLKEKHIKYLKMALGPIPDMFKSLDASQPWLIYWSSNALSVLGVGIEEEVKRNAVAKLLSMLHPDGGMGGGLGQLAHVAASYAGFLALALLGDEQSWAKIDRENTYRWLLSLKQDDGSFVMHKGGEVDTRAVYCAFTIASLLGILTTELTQGTAEWLQQCQTFEGGFGGVPWDEAHGGYTFCAVAAFMILGKDAFLKHVNVQRLAHWVSSRQMSLEGGFSGRTNKLVDGCYSFWVGGIAAVFDVVLDTEIVSRAALQNYILCCCQNEQYGGLRDKPSTNADFYHTNYVLLGLAVAQKKFQLDDSKITDDADSSVYAFTVESADEDIIAVGKDDRLVSINPVFGLPLGVPDRMKEFFKEK